jgi:hypothetical protein
MQPRPESTEMSLLLAAAVLLLALLACEMLRR